MLLGIGVQGLEHDGHNDLDILMHQIQNVLVIPKVESPLCDLKVSTGNTPSDFLKDGNHHFGEFRIIRYIQHFFNFVDKHDFFCTVDLGPISKQGIGDGDGECLIFFQKLHNAVS